jgi:hypothetical protein
MIRTYVDVIRTYVLKQIVAMPCGITRDNHVISGINGAYLFIREPPTSAGNFKRKGFE